MRVECLYRRGRAGRREGGDRPPVAPVGGPPGRPRGGDSPPVARTLAVRDLVANLKKKIIFRAYRPLIGRPRYIFEFFRNGHIFLKF